ncbi:MAG: hypothetical protein KDE03_17520 [Rhodobacteraceae bacterium]|nr:hypothetical protein [Paracoccaceae bacterium]
MRGVSFEVNGREFTLAFSTNAMVAYEKSRGEGVISAFQKMEGDAPSMLLIHGLFWSALTPKMTEDEAGDLIDEIGLSRAAHLLAEAARKAFEVSENPTEPTTKTRSKAG